MSDWIFGEFGSSSAMLDAARRLREQGITRLDTYSPFPIPGAEEALGLRKSRVPWIALTGGLTGVATAYSLQWFANAVDFPINVGGRPLHAAPAFIPITFELGVLFAAFSIFFGLLALMRLPQPYHPGFELQGFRNASTHGFWLSVELPADDPVRGQISDQLRALGAIHVSVVPEAA